MAATYVVSTDFVARDTYSQRLRAMESNTRRFATSAKTQFASIGSVFKGSFLGTFTSNAVTSGLARMGAAIRSAAGEYVAFDTAISRASMKFPEGAKRGSAAFAELEQGARAIGRMGDFSAAQAAAGYDALAAAGYSVADSIKALVPITDFAEASNTDLGAATDITVKSMKAFNLTAKDSSKIGDTYVATFAKSGIAVDQLYGAVQNGGSAFGAAGQSLETYLSLVGYLGQRGVPATRSAMALSSAVTRMANPATVKALKRLGVDVFSGGKMRDVADVFMDLNKSTASMSEQKRLKAFQTIFDARALKALGPLLKGDTEALAQFIASVDGAGGKSKAMSEEIDQSIGDKLDKIKFAVMDKSFDVFDQLFGGKGKLENIISAIRRFDVSPIISGARSLGKVLGFMADHAEGILSVAKSLVIIKGALAVGKLSGGSGVMGIFGGGGLAGAAAGAAGGIGGSVSAQRSFAANRMLGEGPMFFGSKIDQSRMGGRIPPGGGGAVTLSPPGMEQTKASGAKWGSTAGQTFAGVVQSLGVGVAIGNAAAEAMQRAADETTRRENSDIKDYDAIRAMSNKGNFAGARKALKGRAAYEYDRAFGDIGSKISTGGAFLGSLFTGGASPLDEARANAARRKLAAGELLGSEGAAGKKTDAMMDALKKSFEDGVKVEIEVTDGKVTGTKVKSGKAPAAPGVNKSKAGAQ